MKAPLGAQVLNACAPGIGELFYVSSIVESSGKLPRGGVPVIFPQFADRGDLPRHGFARNCHWDSDIEEKQPRGVRVVKSLEVGADQYPGWPHSVKLNLDTYIGTNLFQQTITVTNTGSSIFSWTGGLHPYLLVENLEGSSVSGLEGVSYKDRYSAEPDLRCESSLRWDEQPCEKLFASAPPLILSRGSKQLMLSTTGFYQWMIWNPGKSGATEFTDMEDGDWQRFVCIEPVCVDRPVMLEPGATFSGTLKIEWDV